MSVLGDRRPDRLRLLLDSNVVIAAEPYAGNVEPVATTATQLVRLANEQGHLLCVARATREDLRAGKDPERRAQRLLELGKLHELEEVPLEGAFIARAGASEPGSNDHRDLRILAALNGGAATHLVTEDVRLRRRASRCGLGEAVLTIAEAVDLLTGFAPTEVVPPPRVNEIATYAINSEQAIFDGLRQDYAPDFDAWLAKVRRESDWRKCFVVQDRDTYAAIALVKLEPDCAYELAQPVLKLSTFKVDVAYAGVKYGELLLKAVLQGAHNLDVATLYVEVLPSHDEVVEFLSDFGFRDLGDRTARGELVLVKDLVPGPEAQELDDLDYHIRYGPPALRGTQSMYVVPIQPRWHDQLFPEGATGRSNSQQLSLFPEDAPLTHPWGNAIRKAYLCNSPTKSIRPGDLLLFYRSRDERCIKALGIVESALRSSDPQEVISFVGRRTVYSPDEIAEMCRSVRGLLALRFRQDRFVDPGWEEAELRLAGVLRSWPQSIIGVKEVGRGWVRDQLSE